MGSKADMRASDIPGILTDYGAMDKEITRLFFYAGIESGNLISILWDMPWDISEGFAWPEIEFNGHTYHITPKAEGMVIHYHVKRD